MLCSVPRTMKSVSPIPDLLFPVWEICRLHFLHPAALLTIISSFLSALLYCHTLTNFCPSYLPHPYKLLPFLFAALLQKRPSFLTILLCYSFLSCCILTQKSFLSYHTLANSSLISSLKFKQNTFLSHRTHTTYSFLSDAHLQTTVFLPFSIILAEPSFPIPLPKTSILLLIALLHSIPSFLMHLPNYSFTFNRTLESPSFLTALLKTSTLFLIPFCLPFS
jgi:hypothetical protein